MILEHRRLCVYYALHLYYYVATMLYCFLRPGRSRMHETRVVPFNHVLTQGFRYVGLPLGCAGEVNLLASGPTKGLRM